MDTLDDLIQKQRIRRETISPREVRDALTLARRDIKTARTVLANDWDWGFSIAYQGVINACRALMFSEGFRPASSESHKTCLAFAHLRVGKEVEELIAYFDRMRVKRHQAMYDVAGRISQTEARNIFQKAEMFVRLMERKLQPKKA